MFCYVYVAFDMHDLSMRVVSCFNVSFFNEHSVIYMVFQ